MFSQICVRLVEKEPLVYMSIRSILELVENSVLARQTKIIYAESRSCQKFRFHMAEHGGAK